MLAEEREKDGMEKVGETKVGKPTGRT